MTQLIISFIFTYLVTWWMVLLMVLPFRVQREETPDTGNDHGAPKDSYIKGKFIVTSLITLVLVSVFFYLKENKIIDFEAYITDPELRKNEQTR